MDYRQYRFLLRISGIFFVVLFLVVFALSLAVYYTRPPVPGFSRGIALTTVSTGGIKNLDRPGQLLPGVDGDTAILLVKDGSGFRYLEFDARGQVLVEEFVEAGFGEFSHLAAYRAAGSRISILAGKSDLERIDFEPGRGIVGRQVLVEGIRSFEGDSHRIAVVKSDGLYFLNAESAALYGPVVLGFPLRVVAADIDERYIRAVCAVENGDGTFDMITRRFDGIKIYSSPVLIDNSNDEFYRYPAAFHEGDDGVTVLTVHRDNRYGLTYLNLRRFSEDGSILDDIRTDVPLANSRYSLIAADTLLMRGNTVFGTNIIEIVVSEDGSISHRELTKTREISRLVGNLTISGNDVLVFADESEAGLLVSLASNHPEAVRDSSRWSQTNWGPILGTTLTHFIVSFFATWIFLLAAAGPPAVLVAILQRFAGSGRAAFWILTAGGASGYTLIKLIITRHFIEAAGSNAYLIPLVGTGTGLYIALVFMSLISFGITATGFPMLRARRDSTVEIFARFAIYDAIVYSAMFLLYGVTAMLLRSM